MSLYLKHTPKDFTEIAGNGAEIKALLKHLNTPGHNRAFLFTGPFGTGKTICARLLADKVFGELREINASDDRGIDMVREVIESTSFLYLTPTVYFFDEAALLTAVAQDALLKVLQDIPENVYFIFATTNPEKLKEPLKSRCFTVSLKNLSQKELKSLCLTVLEKEQTTLDSEVLDEVVYRAAGSPRKALVLLEKVLGLDSTTAFSILENGEEEAEVIELCRLLTGNSDWPTMVGCIGRLNTSEWETVRHSVLGYCAAVMKNQPAKVTRVITEFSKPFYDSGKAGFMNACYRSTQRP